MIVGGISTKGYSSNSFSDAQIVDLSNQTSKCSSLQNYPYAFSQGTGALVSGHAIICGGYSRSSGSAHSDCYHHRKATNSWIFLTNMTTKRHHSASVPVKGKLWVLGGRDGDNKKLSTTEYISPDSGASQPGPDLPSPRAEHCAVKLSNGKVIVLGGALGPSRKSAIIFNPDTETFDQSLPTMTYDRSRFGCATFNSQLHENREVVLAVGGANTFIAEVLDYTQPNPAWTTSNYSVIFFLTSHHTLMLFYHSRAHFWL